MQGDIESRDLSFPNELSSRTQQYCCFFLHMFVCVLGSFVAADGKSKENCTACSPTRKLSKQAEVQAGASKEKDAVWEKKVVDWTELILELDTNNVTGKRKEKKKKVVNYSVFPAGLAATFNSGRKKHYNVEMEMHNLKRFYAFASKQLLKSVNLWFMI